MLSRHLAYILLGLAILGVILGALYFIAPQQESEAAPIPVSSWSSWFDMSHEARLLFVGDMMFDRYVRQMANQHGYDHIFSEVRDVFSEYDLVMGNLEGPITLHPSLSTGTKPGDPTNMVFTFSSDVPEALRRAGVDAVSLANNHILDFGSQGFSLTTRFLEEEGIIWVGNPHEKKGNVSYLRYNGITVALIAHNQFLGLGLASTVEDIRAAENQADVVVVFSHWGDEYVKTPSLYVISTAHTFVDAGADIVIGAHPHVVQPYEMYSGKRIYYSLGNFIFDQYWNRDVRCGVAVEATIAKKGEEVDISYQEYETGFAKDAQVSFGCTP